MARFDGYDAPRGPSIIDLMWAELDESYKELKESQTSGNKIEQLRGRCAGLAIAIAIVRNPYDPDDDIIRGEAEERYQNVS